MERKEKKKDKRRKRIIKYNESRNVENEAAYDCRKRRKREKREYLVN